MSELYIDALAYASKKHEGQVRKGKIIKKYIEHPIEVSNYVDIYLNGDDEIEKYKIVALLHDTLEDTDATYEEEKKLFGEDIANMVLNLTNNEKKIKKYGKAVYLSKKLVNMESKTLTIKLCDRLCNIKDLVIVDNDFTKKYMNETIYIINYLMLNRSLDDIQIRIINDIMLKINEISYNSKLKLKPKKKALKFKK